MCETHWRVKLYLIFGDNALFGSIRGESEGGLGPLQWARIFLSGKCIRALWRVLLVEILTKKNTQITL